MKRMYYLFLLIALFVISFFSFGKYAYSSQLEVVTVEKKYNNYYFFEEPFNTDYQETSVKYGIFAPPTLGHIDDKIEIINLKKNSIGKNNEITSYLEFYNKFFKIQKNENATFVSIGDNKYCLVFTLSEANGNTKNIYYTHSCWKSGNGDWIGYYTKASNECFDYMGNSEKKYCKNDPNKRFIFSENTESYSELMNSSLIWAKSCASVNKFTYNGASIVKEESDGNNTVFKITRAPLRIVTETEPKTDYSEVKIGESSNMDFHDAGCPDTNEYYVNPTGDKMYSPVLGKYSYKVIRRECKEKSENISSSCNSSGNINQSCSNLTIETGNNTENVAQAEFNVSQTGTISNILTPTEIYQGGGIEFGFMYYNTFNWRLIDGSFKTYGSQNESKNALLKELKGKVLNENVFLNNIKVDFNISSGVEKLMDVQNNLVKNCKQIVSGQFEEGTITTVCSVFLPVSNVKTYSGEIKNISGIVGDGINNKMYTELDYTGVINLSANISGLNIMKNGKDWQVNINPNNTDKSCQVNVYNRLYAERKNGDKSNRYKFIYRPIDLNNPFPSRSAGPNWYEWYNKSTNKERLENSYSKFQYQVELNPSRIAEIKKYNQNNPYFNWDSIDEKTGNSSFVKEYFEIKGQNIVGDKS